MLRVRGRELGQRLRGAADRSVRVAEDVDRGGREMSRAHPFGEDGHALSRLGQPQGRGQPGEAGPDHDRVVARTCGPRPAGVA